MRRVFFRWVLKVYEDKEGFLWKISGAILYGVYKVLLDYEQLKYEHHVDNSVMERGQLELLAKILEQK